MKHTSPKTREIHFKNGDLQRLFRNELNSDDFKMKKDKIADDGEGNPTWCLDFTESSYLYTNIKDRDHDYKLMRQCVKNRMLLNL